MLGCGPVRFRSNAGSVWQTRGKITDESCELFVPGPHLILVCSWFFFVSIAPAFLVPSILESGIKSLFQTSGERPHCTESQNPPHFDSQA